MKIIAAGLLLMNVAFGQTQLRSLRAVPVPACATCHFHAGADHRPQNTLVDPNSPFRVNVELSTVLVRLYLLSHPGNRNSTMVRDSGVRVGSAGTFRRIFRSAGFNTAYYVRNFWDGRAGRTFDGFTVTAANEAEAPCVLIARNGGLERQQARLDWPMLAKTLLSLPPLALQKVAIDDSVLGTLARKEARGLE